LLPQLLKAQLLVEIDARDISGSVDLTNAVICTLESKKLCQLYFCNIFVSSTEVHAILLLL